MLGMTHMNLPHPCREGKQTERVKICPILHINKETNTLWKQASRASDNSSLHPYVDCLLPPDLPNLSNSGRRKTVTAHSERSENTWDIQHIQ